MNIKELKALWKEEKEHYRNTELGTGVQSFVKKSLESENLFNLKEGKLSTKLLNRKNEFIYEKRAKDKGRADFYIYITPIIAIPVEVEKHGNIDAGESQLLKYQQGFDKQYGILTDGFTWRFYNNNIYKTITLDTILGNTDLFLTFWNEYIKPEFYYLSFFEKTGQLALLEEKKLPVEDNRQSFFEDITKLINSFKNKLQIEGYLKDTEVKSKEQRSIELTYSYIIQFILYKTLVDNEFGDFPQEFEELVDTIHKNLIENDYKDILGHISSISNRISKNIYRPFDEEQEFINKRIFELLRNLKNTLKDVSPWLDIFVFIKKYNFANVRNEIFGFIYENYLKELYEEGQKGQYFTDPAVVNFMLKQIGYTSEQIKKRFKNDKDSISLIDPACGSGTFLYAATDIIVQTFRDGYTEEASKMIEDIITNNIFGLDTEEFPIYLAEMSILMALLPIIIHQKYNNPVDKKIKVFKTRDSIAEFLDTALKIKGVDVEHQKKGQYSFFTQKLNLGYESYVRDEDDLNGLKESLEDNSKIPRRRFDYVIGNPPYIGYNQSAKQGVLIFKFMKDGIAKLNNIYGVNLHSVPGNPKKYRPNPNLYTFFIALGLALLKDDGKLCFIIPQTVFVNADLDVVRYHLAKYTTIEKLITFSGKLFLGRGLKQSKPIATSSLIFIVSRNQPKKSHNVEVINYKSSAQEDVNQIFSNIENNVNTKINIVPQNKLLQNIFNWNFITLSKTVLNFHETYKHNSESLESYYNHSLAKLKYDTNFIFDGGYSIDERNILSNPQANILNYQCPKLNNKYWTIKEKIGFWPDVRDKDLAMFIKLRQGNQGYRLLDYKHKIIWSYNNTDKFFYTDKLVIWARNKILGIASDSQKEIYYLFSILNSSISKLLLDKYIKVGQEDRRTILVSLQIIKELIRTPKITDLNQYIKDKIIQLTNDFLNLEKGTLSDLVDFSGVLTQKFDSVRVENKYLILSRGKKETKLLIKKDKDFIQEVFDGNSEGFKFKDGIKEIFLTELMSTPFINVKEQEAIKKHIDVLIFSLYFNINIPDNKLNKFDAIIKLFGRDIRYWNLVKGS